MISSIRIQGYRAFDRFEMSGLKRVNLLVGANNSGKTSVLEAISLLVSRGEPASLWHLLSRRGERVDTVERGRERAVGMDVSHLFHGHDFQMGSKFILTASNENPERKVAFSVGEVKEHAPGMAREQVGVPGLALHITGNPPPPIPALPLTHSGGMYATDALDSPRRIRRGRSSDSHENATPVQFIASESIDGGELISLWDKVALTPNEERVVLALRFLDPGIERIAPQVGLQPFYMPRGGFIVKIKGREHPIPIGSMGDGIWRMMALAIAIAHCKGGILLVDEIDTGLHYTVLENMWRLIFGAAKELDVQVFATTHSSDCIKSLANLCYADTDVAANVTLQRIEIGRLKAVPYTATEIEVAAERQIEVR